MSAATSPNPPPPPGGNGKGGPGHNSPASKKSTPSKAQKSGDGSTKEKAQWSSTLAKDPNQTQYLVRGQTGLYPGWMRCVLGEARFFSDMGFTVWELGPCAARRVELVAGDDGRSRFQPFQWQMDEVVAEEQARVRRHEEIPGEENIPEGVQEEYVNKVASPVGKAMTPSKSGSLNVSAGSMTATLQEAPDAGSSPSASSSSSSEDGPARSDASE